MAGPLGRLWPGRLGWFLVIRGRRSDVEQARRDKGPVVIALLAGAGVGAVLGSSVSQHAATGYRASSSVIGRPGDYRGPSTLRAARLLTGLRHPFANAVVSATTSRVVISDEESTQVIAIITVDGIASALTWKNATRLLRRSGSIVVGDFSHDSDTWEYAPALLVKAPRDPCGSQPAGAGVHLRRPGMRPLAAALRRIPQGHSLPGFRRARAPVGSARLLLGVPGDRGSSRPVTSARSTGVSVDWTPRHNVSSAEIAVSTSGGRVYSIADVHLQVGPTQARGSARLPRALFASSVTTLRPPEIEGALVGALCGLAIGLGGLGAGLSALRVRRRQREAE